MRERWHSAGFSLMEVVISVAIVGIIIPVVLALTVVGGRGSAEAADETRAMLMVGNMLQELELARDEESEMIDGELPWPAFPEAGGRLVFTADRFGELLGEAGEGEYDEGIRDPQVAFIISVRGERHELESVPDAEDLSKVEITVETPAPARAEDRRKLRFVRLIHPDD